MKWLADSQGFVVAYPQGIIGPDKSTGWSSGGVGKPQVNDALFASDLISQIQSKLGIDLQRIYATVVIHYRILRGQHIWPGSSSSQSIPTGDTDFDASTTICNFFTAHPLSSSHTVLVNRIGLSASLELR